MKRRKRSQMKKLGGQKPVISKEAIPSPSHHESNEYPQSPGEHSDSSSKNHSADEELCDKDISAGTVLEVMDFNEQWYPVKVVEVDLEESEVLVHYLKWSDRYDEWVRMDSNRIRRPKRPSTSLRHNFKVGEKVMATWSYSLKFPAVIQALHDDDKVDVLFYDGFAKTLRSCKLSKANEEDLKNMSAPRVYKVAPRVGSDPVETDLCSKEERRERKRKINILEVFHPHLNKRRKIAKIEKKSKPEDIEKKKPIISKPRATISLRKSSGDISDRKESTITIKVDKKIKEVIPHKKIKEVIPDKKIKEVISDTKIKEVIPDANIKEILPDTKVKEVLPDTKIKEVLPDAKIKEVITGTKNKEIPDKPIKEVVVIKQNKQKEKVPEMSNKSVIDDKKIMEKKEENLEKVLSTSKESVSEDDADESLIVTGIQHGKFKKRRRRRKKKEIVLTLKSQKRRTTDEDDPRWHTGIPPGATPFKFEGSDGSARESIIIPDKKLPEGWAKHTMLRRNNTKWDVFLVNPDGRKFRSRNELRTYYNEINEPYPEDNFDFVVGRKQQLIEDSKNRTKITFSDGQKIRPRNKRHKKRKKLIPSSSSEKSVTDSNHKEPIIETSTPKIKIKQLPIKPPGSPTTSGPTEIKRIKTLLPKNKSVDGEDRKLAHSSTSDLSSSVTLSLESLPNTPLPSLSTSVMSPGQEGFTCPIDGCGKNFRKENLLQMHIKHYHPEYSNLVGSTPNVADLAYARTTGEPLEDSRAEMALSGSSFIDRINRFEAERKARASDSGQMWNISTVKKHTLKESPRPSTPKTPEKEISESTSLHQLSVDVGDADVSSSSLESPSITNDTSPKASPSLSIPITSQSEETVLETVAREEPLQPQTETSATGKLHSSSGKEEKTSTIKTILPLRQPANNSAIMMDLVMEEESEDEGAANAALSPTNKSSQKILRIEECSTLTPKKAKPDEATKPDKQEDDRQVLTSPNGGTSYRFARQRTPLVALEKLQVTPDSNGRVVLSATDLDKKPSVKGEIAIEQPPRESHIECVIEPLRKDEIINCTCGYMEEDGLMIQCDLCLCWQHGLCNNISKESDVPEKYVCYICQHPARQRKSFKFSHNQDWIREGKLPSLSFRTKDEPELRQRERMLKKSHELAGNVLQLQTVIQSLRVKSHIAQKPDHPKLYLWAKSWVKEGDSDLKKERPEETHNLERKDVIGRIPEPEAAIDMEDCQLRLLEHIEDYQHQLEARLTSLQAQVAALESEDPDLASDEGPEFYPVTKQTIQMILRDLNTVRKISTIN